MNMNKETVLKHILVDKLEGAKEVSDNKQYSSKRAQSSKTVNIATGQLGCKKFRENEIDQSMHTNNEHNGTSIDTQIAKTITHMS
jgi:hypothetical protein